MSRISYTLTPEMVQSYIKKTNDFELSIIKKGCEIFGISLTDLLGSRATTEIADCRKALSLFFRTLDKQKYTLVHVGYLLRGKKLDHSTIINSVLEAKNHLETEASFKNKYQLLTAFCPNINGLVARNNQ